MRSRWLVPLAVSALLAPLALLAYLPSLDACAPAPPPGRFVDISDETAIIVWDAANKTEHFIRAANFETDAEDFGFLVPTPTPPELEEVDQAAFRYLADLTAPKIRYVRSGSDPVSAGCGCSAAAPRGEATAYPPEPQVSVLQEKQVAGQDAAVLKADDASALEAWLTDHGYEVSPRIKQWVQPYLEQGWTITAFKFAKDDDGNRQVSTSAVRMTFATDKPFYPYREPPPEEPQTAQDDPSAASDEPADSAATSDSPPAVPSRLLRVYFLGSERVQGKLGDLPWHAETPFAREISPGIINPIAPGAPGMLQQYLKLPDSDPEAKWWLTEFEDRASPRPATDDVFFETSPTRETIERPERVIHASHAPRSDVSVYALAALAAAAFVLCRRKCR